MDRMTTTTASLQQMTYDDLPRPDGAADRRREARPVGRRRPSTSSGCCTTRCSTSARHRRRPARDRFLLSKGHGPMAYYAVLAAKGFIPGRVARPVRALSTRRSATTRTATWSPASRSRRARSGHGLPLAVGIALGLRAQGIDARVVVPGRRRRARRGHATPRRSRSPAAVGLDNLTVVAVDNHSSTLGLARRARDAVRASRAGHAPRRRPRPRRARRGAAPYGWTRSPTLVVAEVEVHAMSTMQHARGVRARPRRRPARRGPVRCLVLADISEAYVRRRGGAAPRPGRQRRHPRAAARSTSARGFAMAGHAADRPHLRVVPRRAGVRADQARLQPPGRRGCPGERRRVVRQRSRRAHPSVAGRRRPDRHAARLDDPRARATPTRWPCCCGSRRRRRSRLHPHQRGSEPRGPPDRWRCTVVRRGSRGTVVAVGPMLDNVLEATDGLDVTVLYASTVRPFDAETLVATLGLRRRRAGRAVPGRNLGACDRPTRSRHVPHRLLSLGVPRVELRRYGTRADHDGAHALDAAGLRRSIDDFLA